MCHQSPLVGYRFSPGWDSSKRNHVAKESVPSANFIGKSPTSMKHNCPRFRWLIPICGSCFSSRSAQNTIYYLFWPLEAPTNSKHFLMDKHMKVPKMGLSPKSSIYRWIFPEINHPAFLGYSHGLGNLHISVSGKDRGAVGRMGSLDLGTLWSFVAENIQKLGLLHGFN